MYEGPFLVMLHIVRKNILSHCKSKKDTPRPHHKCITSQTSKGAIDLSRIICRPKHDDKSAKIYGQDDYIKEDSTSLEKASFKHPKRRKKCE